MMEKPIAENKLNLFPNRLDPMERFKLHYKDLSDTIRHFSTIRSTLTTFLLGAGIAALTTYSKGEAGSVFTIAVAIIFFMMALFMCLLFSYRTEKYVLRMRLLWQWSGDTSTEYPGFPKFKDDHQAILHRVRKDLPNRALVLFITLILITFIYVS